MEDCPNRICHDILENSLTKNWLAMNVLKMAMAILAISQKYYRV